MASKARPDMRGLKERVEDLPDGSCLFSVKIGSTQEVKPWVRGWGAAVEVLEPLAFREEMIEEVRQLARVYGVEGQP